MPNQRSLKPKAHDMPVHDVVPAMDAASPLTDARGTLLAMVRRRFGAIPLEVIVDQALHTPADGDFAIWEAAVDAMHRRWEFAQRDALHVARRPVHGAVLGTYTTMRAPDRRTAPNRARAPKAARTARPYVTELERVFPLRASCNCPDFLTSALGVCKHLLVTLDDIFSNPRRAAAARAEVFGPLTVWRLAWDPALALRGPLDRLSGLRLEPPGGRSAAPGRPSSAAGLGALGRVFRANGPDPKVLASPARRLQLLRTLTEALARVSRGQPALASTSAACALVSDELTRAERLDTLKREAPRVMAHLRSLKRQLYPYQREGTERFVRAGRLLLADDMGLGKTTQAIAACHALFLAGKVRRGLVIVPASLKAQWLREWQEATHVPVAVVEGTPAERQRQYRDLDARFLILGYEQLLRDFEHIARLEVELVVLDEAQRIKNYATKSAMQVKALTPAYRLVLTGTPMENRLEELASILDWVDDVALAPKWRLVPWYTAWDGEGTARGKAGARNLDTLRRRMQDVLVRRVRREVLKQLPSRTDTRVPVHMTPQQIEEHDVVNQSIAKLLAVSKRRALLQAEFLRLMQLLTRQRIVSNGLGQLQFEAIWPAYEHARPDAALIAGLFAPKLVEFRRLITDLVVDQRRKVVVFSQWRRMLRLAEWCVRDTLDEAGARAVFFTGAERPSQRTQSIADFHDDPRTSVMFLSDAGGVGLNLQRAANACINLELPWNPAVLEQRVGRIYRLGQKQPIDVYNLVSETGIESRIAGLVGAKQALFAGLFDGTSDELRFDAASSFLTRVERMVSPEALSTCAEAERTEVFDEVEPGDPDDLAPPNDEPAQGHPSTTPSVSADARAEAPTLHSTSSLLAALRVERTREGAVRIEAPPEAAQALLALFEGLSKLLAPPVERPR